MRVTVTWSGIQNAERVTLVTDTLGRVGIFEPPFEDGSLDLFLTETTEFTFTVSNGAGDVVRTAVAEVVPLPRIDEFVVFPSHAESGEPVTISWDVEDAVSVVIEENGQPLPIDPSASSGTYTFTASQPATFRLVATNKAGGTIELSRPFTIGLPEIRAFDVSSTVARLYEPVQFTWLTRGGTQLVVLQDGTPRCTVSTPNEIAQGTCIVTATTPARSTFTLRLVNGKGTVVERSVQVVLTNGPIIESFVTSYDLNCPGESVELSWKVMDDMNGNPPALQLVDSLGNVYDLSGKDPNEDSILVPFLQAGLQQYTLTATTPSTMADSRSLFVENVEETIISLLQVDPPVVSPGGSVTLTWKAMCADEVIIPFGKLAHQEVTDRPFTDISTTGTFVPMTSACSTIWDPDDEGCLAFTFPDGFAFPFDGIDRAAIKLYANGVAGFDLAREGSSFSNVSLPSTSNSWANLAVFWDDLFLDLSQVGYYYQFTTDASGKVGLIIQWGALDNGSKFQMVLWEDGTFDYRYGPSFNKSANSATIGYQNIAANYASVVGYNSTSIGSLANRSWHFSFFEPRAPSGSHVFTAQRSRTIEIVARGLTEARATVELVVE